MVKYSNKFRMSHVLLTIKNSIMTLVKGNVPTYVVEDIMNRLHKGEQEIIIPMCMDGKNKSLVDYLNEFHRYRSKVWNLDFLTVAFLLVSERVKQKLGKFSDIEIEVLEISDTDKRVVIKMKKGVLSK